VILKKLPFLSISKFSQKKVFWGVIGVTVLVLIYALGILPLVEAKRKVREEISLKKKVLSKYEEYLSNRKAVEDELDRTIKQREEVQNRLLPGETPQLGAATLQEIVKRLSEKDGIPIRSFRILEPKESGYYKKISMQIEFNPSNSVLSLGQFIYDIEHYEKTLQVSEMDFLVPNIRMANQLQGSLVISGLMKGTKTEEKGR
jgi:Tfp pilus assembly protein PilO